MKIAFIAQPIDSVIPPNQNSIGIIIFELAKRLVARHNISIYQVSKDKWWKTHNKNDLAVHYIPFSFDKLVYRFAKKYGHIFFGKYPYYASIIYGFFYALQIAVDLRLKKTDVVHIFNFTQFIPIIKFFNPKIKVTIHMECDWLYQLDYSTINIRLHKADLIIGCSDYITDRVVERFSDKKDKCHTVYNGVNSDHFKNHTLTAAKNSKKIILFIGRISPEKGVHVLVSAFVKARQHMTDLQLVLVGPIGSAPKAFIADITEDTKVKELVGYYNSDYKDAIMQLIPKDLLPEVVFIDKIPYNKVAEQYSRATVFVFPSVWEEPFGMPVIEAMASGTPVIATKSGGITELIEDQKSGILVERGDPVGLAHNLINLLTNKNKIEQYGASGRQRVMEKFTWDQAAHQINLLYGSMF